MESRRDICRALRFSLRMEQLQGERMMRTLSLAAAVAGSLLLLAPPAMAQQDQGGWRGTLDQLNRAVNPDTQQRDERYDSRDRRYEGSSDDARDRSDRASSDFRRYSDEEIRDRWGRINDEQRQLQRERRQLEDEMSRRGIRR